MHFVAKYQPKEQQLIAKYFGWIIIYCDSQNPRAQKIDNGQIQLSGDI